MRRTLHPLCAALLIAAPAFAQTAEEPFVSSAQVTIGGVGTDTSGKDLSKFMEYRDLSNGVLSNIGVVRQYPRRNLRPLQRPLLQQLDSAQPAVRWANSVHGGGWQQPVCDLSVSEPGELASAEPGV